MGRPRLDDARLRRHKIGIRLTDAESAAVRRAAGRRRVRPGRFIREAAVEAAGAPPAPAAETAEAHALRSELRRIGGNLNQALRIAHTGGDADLLRAVEAARAAVAGRLAG